MSCKKHFLTFQWERHGWTRRVTHTDDRTGGGTDMWSRTIPVEYVTCHVEYVCRNCGAVRDGGECRCDRAKAEACAVRLACLDRAQDQTVSV
jgi:hypothetical protein